MSKRLVLIVITGAVALSGCSSRPRHFAPVLAATPSDEVAYAAQLETCRDRLAGRMDKSGRLVSAAAGTAVGVGAGYAAGTATMAGSAGMIGAAGAAAAAALMVLPVAGLAVAWGISKIKKTKKERAIKSALAECLSEGGYTVDDWRVMSKREVRELPTDAPKNITSDVPAAPPLDTPVPKDGEPR